MNIKSLLPLTRLVAKVDDDFNIDNSDWISRAAAWTIDGLAQLKCLPYSWQRKKVDVTERIAYCSGITDAKSIRVYTNKGCLIKNLKSYDIERTNNTVINKQVPGINENFNPWTAEETEEYDFDEETSLRLISARNCYENDKNFVLIDENKIELNFDTNWIIVEYYGVATYYDEIFDDYVPYVYDNGDLLEALSWYILYKMLSRGYKHQVFSLAANNELNPYKMWMSLKDKAYASVKNDLHDPDKNYGWCNFFYNSTFRPRD